MLYSFFERFCFRKDLPQPRKRRSSSLPSILFTTTCIDLKPLLPLTITDPINVPLTYHDHGIIYGSSPASSSSSLSSSLDSLSTSKNSSSSSSLLSLSTDDGFPPTFADPATSSSPILSTTTQSCGAQNEDVDSYPRSLSASAVQPIEIEPIISTLLETFRLSLPASILPPKTPTAAPDNPAVIPTAPALDQIASSTDTLDDHTTNSIHPHPHYTRSLRENPDHLRMIVAEVNMMRVNKLISPLRPRAILLERLDPFIPCTPSPLKHSI
ncbi:hypothetical protein [Absidia glauca]|uniref:Uncharacterized protein n=1 Tax=Absidia glauca TaxID=4829 RepID=A0A168S7R4_ABSGL|nr:hypothetical protein [Absidia glauca]